MVARATLTIPNYVSGFNELHPLKEENKDNEENKTIKIMKKI